MGMNTAPASPDSPQSATRHDGWTAQRQRQFCEALAECGNVEVAASMTGMSRESAYRLRRRAAGRAFALAWDAALLLARQRMIDDVIELAFEGAVERRYRGGKLVMEKRRRDPRGLLATIERLGSAKPLGTASAQAVAQDFERFLDCMDADARDPRGYAAAFMAQRAETATTLTRDNLTAARQSLTVGLRGTGQS